MVRGLSLQSSEIGQCASILSNKEDNRLINLLSEINIL